MKPLIAAVGGANVTGLGFAIIGGNPKTFVNIGAMITALIYFVIVAAIVYFLVVVPVNMLAERRKRGEEPEVAGAGRGHRAAAGDPRPAPPAQHLSRPTGRRSLPVRRPLAEVPLVVAGRGGGLPVLRVRRRPGPFRLRRGPLPAPAVES